VVTPVDVEIEPEASAAFALHLVVPAGARAAVYHGHLLSRTLPATALAIRLEVAA
jgi:hypothetical protein